MREREPEKPPATEKRVGGNRVIVTRHTTLERLSHYANIVSLTALAVTGFSMYYGLSFLGYGDAYGIHVISAAVFIAINLIVVPYSAISNGRLVEYWFWWSDAKRLFAVVASFFTGSEYPRYTIYDERMHRFRNRMHPAAKLLLFSHYIAILLATLTGVVLYAPTLNIAGVGISGIIITVLDFVSAAAGLSGLGLARIIHLAVAYWFIIEVILHLGLVLDPKKFLHIKSIFLSGREDLMKDRTAEIVNTLEE